MRNPPLFSNALDWGQGDSCRGQGDSCSMGMRGQACHNQESLNWPAWSLLHGMEGQNVLLQLSIDALDEKELEVAKQDAQQRSLVTLIHFIHCTLKISIVGSKTKSVAHGAEV